MRQAKLYFDQNIAEIVRIGVMRTYILRTYNIQDTDELGYLLRTQIVNIVSTLDCFIHEIVKKGVKKLYSSVEALPPKLRKFNILLDTHHKIVDIINRGSSFIPTSPDETIEYWIEKEIIDQHKLLSFQTPDKISDALSLIWVEDHKWQKICSRMPNLPGATINEKEKYLKQAITLLAERRNQIVHEADYDVILDRKRDISESDVNINIALVHDIVTAIYDEIHPLFPPP